MRISEMIEELASLNDLDSRTTQTRGTHTEYQTTQTDAEFISSLLSAAVSEAGRRDYMFFVEDGVRIVFAVPNLRESEYQFRFSAYVDDAERNEVVKAELIYNRNGLRKNGALFTRVRGFDRQKKMLVEGDANDGKSFPKMAPYPIENVPDNPSTILISDGPGFNQNAQEEVDGAALANWSKNHRTLFRLRLTTLPLPLARVGYCVDVDMKDSENRDHFAGGRYLVYGIEQRMIAGSPQSGVDYETVLFLERRTRR
jgi:hypothetical protein